MAASIHTKEVGEYLVDADNDHPLGETPNCEVPEGEHVPSWRKVAAKMVKCLKCVPTDTIDDEAKIMKNLPSLDNVVKLSEQTSEGEPATPYISVTNMECVDKVTTDEKIVGLAIGSDNEEKEILVVVDTIETKAVWIDTPDGWERISEVPNVCQVMETCICQVHGGFYLLGGWGAYNVTCQCYFFSFATNRWERIQSMSIARVSLSAAVVGNTLVAAGGSGGTAPLDVCEKLDLASRTWSSATPMPRAIETLLSAASAGCVYIKDCWTCSLFCYDPNIDAYIEIIVPGNVPVETPGACMIHYENALYILGGSNQVAVRYNPLTQSWLQLTPPRANYRFGCCAVVRSDKVLLFGGSTWGGDERDLIEEYDVQKDTWKQLDLRLPVKYMDSWCRIVTCRK